MANKLYALTMTMPTDPSKNVPTADMAKEGWLISGHDGSKTYPGRVAVGRFNALAKVKQLLGGTVFVDPLVQHLCEGMPVKVGEKATWKNTSTDGLVELKRILTQFDPEY